MSGTAVKEDQGIVLEVAPSTRFDDVVVRAPDRFGDAPACTAAREAYRLLRPDDSAAVRDTGVRIVDVLIGKSALGRRQIVYGKDTRISIMTDAAADAGAAVGDGNSIAYFAQVCANPAASFVSPADGERLLMDRSPVVQVMT